MSKLPDLSSYEASFLNEASQISPALRHYLGQNPVSDSSDNENFLRHERNQAWCQAALVSLQGGDAAPVCASWSETADHLLQKAFTLCFGGQKIALFALGKLGSRELNLSSDVDILLICENDEGADNVSWTSGLREFQKLLSERTPYGFVFRLDFDLRPGGRHGPLIPTLEQFKDYYGNYGETWERLAFVRLRPIAGDAELQKEALAFAKKFTFRRHLDFTLLEDLKNLRQKIHAHYWARTQEKRIDLKLGIGGIRDVELFVHALQVVHGGKDSELQIPSTQEALDKIAEKKLLPTGDVRFLQKHYWNLRRMENYVQALRDEQTHLLKCDETLPDFAESLLKHLEADMQRCDQLVSGLLGKAPQKPEKDFDPAALGISDPDWQEHWNEILQQEVLSRSKERDETARRAFLEEFLREMKTQRGDLGRGLALLKDFIKATRAKATFFSLLLREKNLLSELAWLFGHSPYLSRILCHRPELLDSFVYRSQDKPSEDWSQLLDELSERKLLSEVINGSHFLRDHQIEALMRNLSSTADGIVVLLLERLKKDYPSQVQILALGKWGGQEMGFKSDLDFIFVVPDEPDENDFKLAKRMISRLTDPHRGGAIYSIDMRLRPSGKAGPLVIPEKDLREYLLNDSSAWERQAYLKARWIGGQGIDIASLCLQKGVSNQELPELERIRQKLSGKVVGVDLKYSPGALIDTEFAAQIYCLKNQISPPGPQALDFLKVLGPAGEKLSANYLRLRQIEQMLQLVASEPLSRLDQNHESFPFLAIALQTAPNELLREVNSKLSENLQILNDLDPRRGTH